MFEVERPAIVLGSTQREDVLDLAVCREAGVEVVRRRSGGGVVLVEPGGLVWFDVVVPSALLHDVGVGDDIGASMVWLGEHIARRARRRDRAPGCDGVHRVVSARLLRRCRSR